MNRWRAASPSTYHLLLPSEIPSSSSPPPSLLPSSSCKRSRSLSPSLPSLVSPSPPPTAVPPPPTAVPPPPKHIELVGDDIETLRASLASSIQKTMTLRARVGSLEQHDVITRESLRIARGRFTRSQLRAEYVEHEVRELREFRVTDGFEMAELRIPPLDPYSAVTQFGGVTDWHQSQGYREPGQIYFHVGLKVPHLPYKAISIPFGGLSDIRSLGVNGPPVMPEDPYAYVVAAFQAPPSSDYVPGLEEPNHAPLLPEFIPEPVYPMRCPEEDPIDYPADGGDDDDEKKYSTDDDEDRRYEIRHRPIGEGVARLLAIPTPPPSPLSLWSSPLPQITSSPLPVLPNLPVSPLPLPASPTYPLGYRAAMIRLRAETPSTSHPLPLPPPIVLPHTRASVAMIRAVAPSTYILASRSGILPSETPPSRTPPLLPIPLPTPSLPLLLPSTDYRAGVSEATLPPRKRLCIALGPRYEVGESSYAPTTRLTGGLRADYGFVGTLDDEIRRDLKRYVGYRITNTWEDMVEDIHGTPIVTDMAELSQRKTEFVTTVKQDTDEIYGRLDDAQDDRLLMSGRLNMLFRDIRAHAHTALLMEREARLSREAWGRSMDASDIARSEVRALRTIVLAQQMKIAAL
ncbi:hypothetical protein Tco_0422283 [Tanacetum coccineum]